MNLNAVLKRPVITEKSLQDASNGVFTFEVSRSANKNQIKEAVESVYGVDVVSIRTTVLPGKAYRVGRRRIEKIGTASKKARIQLQAGQKIDLFELDEGN